MRKYLFIGIGGSLGACLRYAIKNISLFHLPQGFPLDTLLINTAGCFLLGLILTISLDHADPDVKTGITIGFIGAFTTFSALCKDMVGLLSFGSNISALLYMLLSVSLGLGATILGITLAEWMRGVWEEKKCAALQADEDAAE